MEVMNPFAGKGLLEIANLSTDDFNEVRYTLTPNGDYVLVVHPDTKLDTFESADGNSAVGVEVVMEILVAQNLVDVESKAALSKEQAAAWNGKLLKRRFYITSPKSDPSASIGRLLAMMTDTGFTHKGMQLEEAIKNWHGTPFRTRVVSKPQKDDKDRYNTNYDKIMPVDLNELEEELAAAPQG